MSLKKCIAILLSITTIVSFTACAGGQTDKTDISEKQMITETAAAAGESENKETAETPDKEAAVSDKTETEENTTDQGHQLKYE